MDSWQSIYDKFGIELKMIGPYNLHKIKIPGYKYITHQIFANDTDLAKYYNTCKCFVMPSKCESFCCSLVEALACNAPCVIDGIIGSVKNFEGMDKYVCGSGREWQNRLVENIESIMSCSNVPVDSSKFVENLFSISANKTKLKTFINLCLDRPPY